MDVLMLVLRVLHIASGVFWVGTAWFFFGFVEPTTKAIGPLAGPFMHHVVRQRRVTTVVLAVSTINVVAGAILYWRVSGGLSEAWLRSGTGAMFTFGALCAITAWLLGITMIAPTVDRLDRVATAVATAGRPPTGEELATLGALQHRLHRVGQVDVVLLAGAVIGMATARYVFF